MLLKQTCE